MDVHIKHWNVLGLNRLCGSLVRFCVVGTVDRNLVNAFSRKEGASVGRPTLAPLVSPLQSVRSDRRAEQRMRPRRCIHYNMWYINVFYVYNKHYIGRA